MRTENISAVLGRAYYRPLGRTLQLRRTFEIGMAERMDESKVILPGMRWFVCKIGHHRDLLRGRSFIPP